MEVKELLIEKFNINIDKIELIGEGYDSKAYLVNGKYIFKIKYSTNKKKGYKKEKAIYDFLDKNLNSTIQVPKIEYSYISDEISILGYKEIKGIFLTPDIYNNLSVQEQEKLKNDIALFLRKIHDLNIDKIKEYVIDNKQNVLEEYELLRQTIYDSLTNTEREYIENFMIRLNETDVFNGKKCLNHNDFSCNHILLDDNNNFSGVIDFGDAGIIDEYCDFIYLLEDSEEELGKDFGIDVLNKYGNIDINKAIEYQEIVEQYYPIETIIYGIKNNNNEFIEKGRKELLIRCRNYGLK